MKKALTIILTLILGFGANYLVVLGLICLCFYMDLTPVWFAAAAVVIAALTVPLHFIRKKLTKRVHGTAIILCAQLPLILFFAVDLIRSVYRYKSNDLRGFERLGAGFDVAVCTIAMIIPTIIMAAAFAAWTLSANKNKILKWWSTNF